MCSNLDLADVAPPTPPSEFVSPQNHLHMFTGFPMQKLYMDDERIKIHNVQFDCLAHKLGMGPSISLLRTSFFPLTILFNLKWESNHNYWSICASYGPIQFTKFSYCDFGPKDPLYSRQEMLMWFQTCVNIFPLTLEWCPQQPATSGNSIIGHPEHSFDYWKSTIAGTNCQKNLMNFHGVSDVWCQKPTFR